jgi:hypothetical protein
MQKETNGFGYVDAHDIDAKEPKWVIDEILTEGFGFLAGAPKANNSPHGGKSVFSLAMVSALLSGGQFLGREVEQLSPILLVNLDQPSYEVASKYKQILNGAEQKGLMISKAYSMQLPKDICKIEEDIITLRPKILIIDPLLRCAGGKDIKEAANTGPIIDELKRLAREYHMIVLMVHHSIKKLDRDKESTSTWLSGSTDLDSAWDFCLCLEWERQKNYMHMRCFFREFGRRDIFYTAIKNDEDKIIGLSPANGETPSVKTQLIEDALKSGNKTVTELFKATEISESTIKRCLKNGVGEKFSISGKHGNAPVWALTKVSGNEHIISSQMLSSK